jgi:hypothetical protein
VIRLEDVDLDAAVLNELESGEEPEDAGPDDDDVLFGHEVVPQLLNRRSGLPQVQLNI